MNPFKYYVQSIWLASIVIGGMITGGAFVYLGVVPGLCVVGATACGFIGGIQSEKGEVARINDEDGRARGFN